MLNGEENPHFLQKLPEVGCPVLCRTADSSFLATLGRRNDKRKKVRASE